MNNGNAEAPNGHGLKIRKENMNNPAEPTKRWMWINSVHRRETRTN